MAHPKDNEAFIWPPDDLWKGVEEEMIAERKADEERRLREETKRIEAEGFAWEIQERSRRERQHREVDARPDALRQPEQERCEEAERREQERQARIQAEQER
jgi:hypothetical protein